MNMRAPFNQMVKNLERIASHASAADRKFIGLSAGVNWRTPETSVVRLLKRELDLAMTSRNYGNAGGTPAVTRTLESLENHTHHCRGLAVTLVHGTTEGSSLALDCWASSSVLQAGGKALMIGHAFPLYHRLSTDRKLDFHECLGDEANSHSFLPSELAITESLEQLKPKVIFLLLPNNPLGEIINPASLARIVDYVRAHDARLLVDRVCLMPWDAPKLVRDLLGPLVLEGRAAMSDSFSKSDSLAGLRMGYLVTSADMKAQIVEAIKSRFLNPPVFGSATLALTRAASLGEQRARRYLNVVQAAHNRLYGEYPPAESFHDYLDEAAAGLRDICLETAARKKEVHDNFQRLQDVFGNRVARSLRFDGGFNVALALDAMDAQREESDHIELAETHGVGVLTSSCFCQTPVGRKYFVRIGLTLPGQQFAEGLQRLNRFYHR